ncbi:MAG: flagellar motor switch protein FliN [Alphaproteobacteria bacterium]|nr:flagellar motor switch protein FliN [Alphaproteobacteria bacterium]
MSDETENQEPEDQNPIEEGAEAESAGDSEDGNLNYDEIEEPAEIQNKDKQEYSVGEAMAGDVTAIYDIPVNVSAVLGSSTMQVSQLLKLGRGAVVELDRKVGEAIDIYVNNRLVARGEVVVVEDKLGITMTEIVKSDRS